MRQGSGNGRVKTDLPEMKLHPAHVVLTDTEALGAIWITTRGSCFAKFPAAKVTPEQHDWILQTMQEMDGD